VPLAGEELVEQLHRCNSSTEGETAVMDIEEWLRSPT